MSQEIQNSFITNQDRFLSEIIEGILPKSSSVDILVGYFYYSGFEQIYKSVGDKCLRVLVGLEVDTQIMGRVREVNSFISGNTSRGQMKDEHYKSLVRLFNETDNFDSDEKLQAFELFYKKIKEGTLEIRKTMDPCHAKMYIFDYDNIFNEGGEFPGTVITGSSNLSHAGLKGRIEINARFDSKQYYLDGKEIFNSLWKDAISIADSDTIDEFDEKVIKHIWYDKFYDPYLMYVRVLHEYFTIPTTENLLTPFDITDGMELLKSIRMDYSNKVDIKENEILKYDRQLLQLLLKDNSSKKNIIWATDNYEPLGVEYSSSAEIMLDLISGENGTVIRPRVNKTRDEQLSRVRDKAEVFTPSWVCNCQNNLIDEAWFGEKDIFNIEIEKGWDNISRPVPFCNGKSWKDYVQDVRLEITCGEAPYLVSRYDTITGDPISTEDRIGLLDRKLRVVSENTETESEWIEWAMIAVQSVYGFEWQGDNLLLARENILYSYIDFFVTKFNKFPEKKELREIAKIISWNIWQMDGLKGIIPNSCCDKVIETEDLFGDITQTTQKCRGCVEDNVNLHNGIYCKIKDWKTGGTIKYISLLK